jgi:hypothetical protein
MVSYFQKIGLNAIAAAATVKVDELPSGRKADAVCIPTRLL